MSNSFLSISREICLQPMAGQCEVIIFTYALERARIVTKETTDDVTVAHFWCQRGHATRRDNTRGLLLKRQTLLRACIQSYGPISPQTMYRKMSNDFEPSSTRQSFFTTCHHKPAALIAKAAALSASPP